MFEETFTFVVNPTLLAAKHEAFGPPNRSGGGVATVAVSALKSSATQDGLCYAYLPTL